MFMQLACHTRAQGNKTKSFMDKTAIQKKCFRSIPERFFPKLLFFKTIAIYKVLLGRLTAILF